MSYDISLYRTETKVREENAHDADFFEKEEKLVPFTGQQFQELKERLLSYNYKITGEDDHGLHFSHSDGDFGTALLTGNALYFTASWNENSIFEVGMVASEFTDSGEYAKYDFQLGEWEVWE
ncbi:hypothetical protein [Sphingobacterium puteale]|uniref:hypothetical protein n=1 Tax=Sphingobacterium puteale TaxID=2420510 RepID=UPI003D950BE1